MGRNEMFMSESHQSYQGAATSNIVLQMLLRIAKHTE